MLMHWVKRLLTTQKLYKFKNIQNIPGLVTKTNSDTKVTEI